MLPPPTPPFVYIIHTRRFHFQTVAWRVNTHTARTRCVLNVARTIVCDLRVHRTAQAHTHSNTWAHARSKWVGGWFPRRARTVTKRVICRVVELEKMGERNAAIAHTHTHLHSYGYTLESKYDQVDHNWGVRGLACVNNMCGLCAISLVRNTYLSWEDVYSFTYAIYVPK